jgi:hypothetical protein
MPGWPLEKTGERCGTSCEQNKSGIWNKQATIVEVPVIRIARESLALVSVASFVWMMCSVAQLVA